MPHYNDISRTNLMLSMGCIKKEIKESLMGQTYEVVITYLLVYTRDLSWRAMQSP